MIPMGFSHISVSKEFACNKGDLGFIPGLGRSLGEGNGNPLQYSCLENPMNSVKRQKGMTLKDELPNMLLEISGEITPERMKGWSQSKNNTQLWM